MPRANPQTTSGRWNIPANAPISERIYLTLLNNGASTTQAIGIMANMIHESGLNPESSATDSNGQLSWGLVSFNNGSPAYANAQASALTGNVNNDINAQVRLIAANGGFQAAAGSTPSQAAANFAHNFERCAACGYNQGSSQLSARSASASTVQQWLTSGNWPTAAGSTGSGGGPGSSSSGADKCLVPILGTCLFKESNARALLGGALMVGGGLTLGLAMLALSAEALKSTGATKALKAVPGGQVASKAVGSRRQAKQTEARRAASAQAGAQRRTNTALAPSAPQLRYMDRLGDSEGVRLAQQGKLTRVQASARIRERTAASAA
ncbi:MAG: phage tail tip lysozyme [Dermatophilaceae bacterium]